MNHLLPSRLYPPVDPYHFSYHNSQINICHSNDHLRCIGYIQTLIAHRANEGESPCGDGRRPSPTDLCNFQEIVGSTRVNIVIRIFQKVLQGFSYNVKYASEASTIKSLEVRR
ncbi:hypothetical protein Y032_0557g3393 [Ancylostoma ceylanicum]|uniref:Uncharacterized protein n=1 Tax=Ancylostoma ceylanicum TaxID=53326 RepID=A0A016WR62_9BILA|nr:hypothetical protein Y032_0557g3393 [Ancylostoma ceylanicum]